MMKKYISLQGILTIVIAMLALGCSNETQTNEGPDISQLSKPFEGKWEVSYCKGEMIGDSTFPYGRAFLAFQPQDSTFTGFTGCNQISGTFIMGSSEAQFPQFVTTRKACPLDFEMTFQDILRAIRHYEFDNGLHFQDSIGEEMLTLVKVKPHPLSLSHD